MASFYYNPFADSVSLEYKCPHCGHHNSETIDVPTPDWCAESHHDSVNSDYTELYCEKCGSEFQVTLATGIYGGEGEIEEIEELLGCTENIPGEDDDYFDKQLYDLTHTDIDKLLEASAALPEDVIPVLYKLLYANAITMMETYLGDTLRREVLKDENSIRKFVETYKPYKKEEIKLSDFFCKKDTLTDYIRQTLNDLLYHNLPKIKSIYREALNVDLGDIGELVKAVKVRHDIVHRNGEDKDGNIHVITKENVQQLQERIQQMIEKVNSQIYNTDASIQAIFGDDKLLEAESPFD